jgi:hypothetical protein
MGDARGQVGNMREARQGRFECKETQMTNARQGRCALDGNADAQ